MLWMRYRDIKEIKTGGEDAVSIEVVHPLMRIKTNEALNIEHYKNDADARLCLQVFSLLKKTYLVIVIKNSIHHANNNLSARDIITL